ncbi:hypothetical protein DPMN_110275 [Dreissena polymorpha]|uniref:Uncharacterized protein n=1 Tax=Dreissena polymorpha TaxID=45954 RepID=A0A9D4KCJ4_DREPO|nr:hypothetical protein DPMN_110275 [Dreissena polymorpha]
MLPLSLVDHSSFKDFVHELDSRYKFPGKKTVSDIITKLYETAQSLLRLDLSRAPNVALTHDTWTLAHSFNLHSELRNGHTPLYFTGMGTTVSCSADIT